MPDQADKRSDAEQGSEVNNDLGKPAPGVQIVPKPLPQNVPKVMQKPLALETGETSPGLPNYSWGLRSILSCWS